MSKKLKSQRHWRINPGRKLAHQYGGGSRLANLQEFESSIIIEAVQPEINGGRWPIKREVGDRLEVSADIYKEGHDVLSCVLRYGPLLERDWQETPMQHIDNDRWAGHFELPLNTRYRYSIGAFINVFESWRVEVRKKHEAGERIESELLEGRMMVDATARGAKKKIQTSLNEWLVRWRLDESAISQLDIALQTDLKDLMEQHQERYAWTTYDRELEVVVDRPLARYGAWYELFPRSQGRTPGRSATLQECQARLPAIKAMGFDVLYITPIHPIGRTHRKGKNNELTAKPADPGSPYAIGNELGGHDALEPGLGTMEDFDHFQKAVRAHGMELAMDFAINCSPDHPYVKAHPEWFAHRPDGTIKYAENPPKKYQDIYNLNF